jgi:hypothetical protein
MKLDPPQSISLCEELMDTLLRQSDTLRAALQSAGCERKMEGWIQQGMASWLSLHANHLLCLTEYRGLDFIFLNSDSVGSNRINVDTLFEAKFNYTSQRPELLHRPAKSVAQLRSYIAQYPGADGYLLYIVADNLRRAGSARHHDKGWHYLGTSCETRFATGLATLELEATKAGLACLGSATGELGGWQLHLRLFKCATVASAQMHASN